MLLPMAVPAYVIAYVYTDLLEYAGPVQSFLRRCSVGKCRRLLVPGDPQPRRRHRHDVAGALSLRVPAFQSRFSRAIRGIAGRQPDPGLRSLGDVLSRVPAHGATVYRHGRRVGAHGNVERRRHRGFLRGAHPHARHLRRVAQHGEHRRRGTDRHGHARLRDDIAHHRTTEPAPPKALSVIRED